jgi:ribosomal protein L37E
MSIISIISILIINNLILNLIKMVKNKLKIKKKTPYICNRCGRNNFINGHALGGHKKYCKKPEYDKARIRNSLKKPRNNYKPKNKKERKKTPYICNRCGRNNFINGHALGGHKKYCKKPEYDKARIRNSLKKPRNNYKPKNKINIKKDEWDLLTIVDSINSFTNEFEKENEMNKKKLNNLLGKSLDKNDLEELETIHWFLNEDKRNLISLIDKLN